MAVALGTSSERGKLIMNDQTSNTVTCIVAASADLPAVIVSIGSHIRDVNTCTVTLNGASGVLIGKKDNGQTGSNRCYTEVWRFIPSGSSGSRTVAIVASGSARFSVGVLPATGVDQTTPIGASTDNASAADDISLGPIAAASGDLGLVFMTGGRDAVFPSTGYGANQTVTFPNFSTGASPNPDVITDASVGSFPLMIGLQKAITTTSLTMTARETNQHSGIQSIMFALQAAGGGAPSSNSTGVDSFAVVATDIGALLNQIVTSEG